MFLFAGSSHQRLAEDVAKELQTNLGNITLKTFSCGEQYVKFDQSVRGHDVYLLQSTQKDPDSDLMELFLMCQAAKLSFARSIHVIIPHFPYARQDRVAEPREPISAKLIARLLETSGADHVITLNLHSDQIQGFFSVPVDALDATSTIFAPYFNNKTLKNPVVVSPDAGGAKRAKSFADDISADLAIMHKSRPQHNQAEIMEVVGEVEGRTCIIFDDMIDTAGSLVSAKNALIQRGAGEEIYAVATHPIFSGAAIERLSGANFTEVVTTDSIAIDGTYDWYKQLRIAPYLAQVMKRVQEGGSVTQIGK